MNDDFPITKDNLSPNPAQTPSLGQAYSLAQMETSPRTSSLALLSPQDSELPPSPEQAIELRDMRSGIESADNALRTLT